MATELILFKANVTFTFKGDVQVYAEDKEQAFRLLQAKFEMINNGGIHTTIDSEEIDWDFPTHPDKKITNLHKA